MVMKNEKGITLVELLAAVVIAGIIIVPLLTTMTDSFTRTVSQKNETEIAYVAQDVMEKVRLHSIDEGTYCWSNPNSLCGTNNLPFDYIPSTDPADLYNIKVEITSKEYPYNDKFNEVAVEVINQCIYRKY